MTMYKGENSFMKKDDINILLYLCIQIVVNTVIAMIVWPILDIIICNVFTHSQFIYSVNQHIIQPIVFGLIIAGINTVLYAKKKKN